MKKLIQVLGGVAMAGLLPALLLAEVVKEVGSDGGLTLEDGRKFVLAGVKMDEEGAAVLRVLAQKRDVRLEILDAAKTPDGVDSAYAYLKARSQAFPPGNRDSAGEDDLMLNEFLVRTGAARVDESQAFARKERFLKAQEEARKKGEGVWSYAGS